MQCHATQQPLALLLPCWTRTLPDTNVGAWMQLSGVAVSCTVDTGNEMVTQSHNLFNIASAFSYVCMCVCSPLLRPRTVVNLMVAGRYAQDCEAISRSTRVFHSCSGISPSVRRCSQQPRRRARTEETACGGDKGIQFSGSDRAKQSAVSSKSTLSTQKLTRRSSNRVARIPSVQQLAVALCTR
eukprot:COSAG02_NODE_248_length_27133_cov_45.131723_24_plen_184_part_00